MTYTVAQIAKALKANAFGAVDLLVNRIAEPGDAQDGELALALNPKFADGLNNSQARVAMLWDGADWESYGLEAAILVPRARFAMAGLTELFDTGMGYAPGIHPTAVISEDAQLAANVSVGAFSIIEAGARIGENTVIGPQTYVGADVVLGKNAIVKDHVTLAARVIIGDNFWCQHGARIGGDGFSFVTPEKSNVEEARETLGAEATQKPQSWARIHSVGSVTIGDNVEVGANATIDRGTIRDTRVGNGVKIDNLVQIGHNVVIGDDCLLCAQSGVAGSTQIGNNVVLGGQTGVSDNLTVGDNVITGGNTTVLSSVPSGRVLLGTPATKMETQIEAYKGLRRLPRLMKDVADLKKAVLKLTSND